MDGVHIIRSVLEERDLPSVPMNNMKKEYLQMFLITKS
jgi:hypothetical protein